MIDKLYTVCDASASVSASAEYGPLDDFWYREVNTGKSFAGVNVDVPEAMTYSAAYAATVVLSTSGACLPLKIKHKHDNKRRVAYEHDVHDMLSVEPNEHSSDTTFRLRGFTEQINWDKGFIAEIERSSLGKPVSLWPVHPTRVRYEIDKSNRLHYYIKSGNTENSKAAKDMFHVPGKFCPDGIGSLGVITQAREGIGSALAAVRHGASSFKNGVRPSIAVTMDKTLTGPQRANLQTDLSRYQGSENASKAILLEKGMGIEPFSFSHQDAQYLQTRQHDIEEVARWYNLPPHMIQHLLRATYSNIEQQSIEYVTYSLMPWLILWEKEINRKLLTREERKQGYYAKHEVEGLLRGDAKSRAEYFKNMFNMGVLSPNEIRELEDLDPIPGGDIFLVPMNLTSIDNAGKQEPTITPINEPEETNEETTATEPSALQPVAKQFLIKSLQYVTKIETDRAVAKSADSKVFMQWLEGFYGGHISTCKEHLQPAIDACREAGASISDSFITDRCKAHRQQLEHIYSTAQPAEFKQQISDYMFNLSNEIEGAANELFK